MKVCKKITWFKKNEEKIRIQFLKNNVRGILQTPAKSSGICSSAFVNKNKLNR